MENVEPNIRNAVRALIIRDHHILLLRKGGDARGERYAGRCQTVASVKKSE